MSPPAQWGPILPPPRTMPPPPIGRGGGSRVDHQCPPAAEGSQLAAQTHSSPATPPPLHKLWMTVRPGGLGRSTPLHLPTPHPPPPPWGCRWVVRLGRRRNLTQSNLSTLYLPTPHSPAYLPPPLWGQRQVIKVGQDAEGTSKHPSGPCSPS